MSEKLPYFYVSMFHSCRGKDQGKGGFATTLAYSVDVADINFAMIEPGMIPAAPGWCKHGHLIARHGDRLEYLSPFTAEDGSYCMKSRPVV